MDDKHIGSVISAEAHNGDVYQGKLTTLGPGNSSVTMANVIKNGLPLHRCCTLSVSEIRSLRVLRVPPGSAPSTPPAASAPSSSSFKKPAVPRAKQQQLPATSSSDGPTSPSLTSSSMCSSHAPPTSSSNSSVLPPKSKGGRSAGGGGQANKFSAPVEQLFEAHAKAKSPVKSAPSKSSSSSRQKPRGSPSKNVFTHCTEEISATPLFKNFEPQVRQPKVLNVLMGNERGGQASGKGSSSKKQGPSGNPLLDAINHYPGIRRSNKNNLSEPIDFDLDSDFDFAENLKLFEKDVEDDEYYENVEKLKVSQNFAHYENIIEDENRVTSWTNLNAKNKQNALKGQDKIEKKANFGMNAVSFEKTMDGHPIPAISVQEKKEFLAECKSALGEHVLDTIIADRIFQWVSEIQLCHGDAHGTIILLASASNSVRSIRRLLTHFDNRRYNCHLFGKFPGEQFPHVNVVKDVKSLPKQVPIICILSSEINEDVESWLRTQDAHSPHFVCVEAVPSVLEPSRCHLLQFGCATNGLRHVERKVPDGVRGTQLERLFQQSKKADDTVVVDSAIADLGSPSCWFDDLSAKFISTAFATTFLVRLSN